MMDTRLRLGLLAALTLAPSIAIADDAGRDELCKKQLAAPDSGESSDAGARLTYLNNALCDTETSAISGDRTDTARRVYYYLDRPGRAPSEILRALLVYTCLYNPPTSDQAQARYAVCGLDARRLDRKALESEIDTLKLNAYGRARAIALWDAAKKLAGLNEAKIREAAGSDERVKALVYDLPEKGFAEFDKFYAANKDAVDAAIAVEDKARAIPPNELNKAHPMECDALRGRLEAFAGARKPKSPEDVRGAFSEPLGFWMMSRLALCDAAGGRWVPAAAEAAVLQLGALHHGPRTAAFNAMIERQQDWSSQFRDMVAKLAPSRWQPWREAAESAYSGHVTSVTALRDDPEDKDREPYNRHMKQGKLTAVKKTADGVLLTFKKEKWVEPVFTCENTGKIIQWSADGQPQFLVHCKETGSQQLEWELAPQLVDERSGRGLKVGQIVKVASTETRPAHDPAMGFVIEVADAAGKGKPKILSGWGVPLR
jgi:hypothetical protein